VLMDQTKDCYRIVLYDINVDLDYGAVIKEPEVDYGPVEELEASIAERNKEKEKEKKALAKKKKKKPTEAELAMEEEQRLKEEAEDAADVAKKKKDCEDMVADAREAWAENEKVRVRVLPPLYPPELPLQLEPPVHPKNTELYESLIDRKNGHCGDRVMYTDGGWHDVAFVNGSTDGMCKGGGLSRELVENWGWKIQTLEFTEAYDGGKTLRKHDCYPEDDPAEWEFVETEKWKGMVRVAEKGKDSEEW